MRAASAWLLAAAAVLTAVAWMLLPWGWWRWLALAAAAALAAGAAWLARRRSEADPAGKTGEQAWEELLAAAGGGRPCWLVLGSPGSGKSQLLAESGVPWSHRPGPLDGQPRAWCHEGGVLVELPGAWASSPEPADGWTRLLARAAIRRRLDIRGLVACVPLSDLLRRGPTWSAQLAATLAARGRELAARLGRRPPIYLVLTKADHIGGYKDFFAGIADGERQQVLGATLPWPCEDPAARWGDEHLRLVAALSARRPLGLLRARDGDSARKLLQFPGQLAALAGPAGSLIAALSAGGDGALLRGVYLASAHRPAAAAPSGGTERLDIDGSVYLGPRAAPAAGAAPGCGHFSHALLARVLPNDRALRLPTAGARRRTAVLRLLALVLVPLAAALAAVWLLAESWRGAALLDAARRAGAELLAVERLHPEDAPRNLDALDRFGTALAGLAGLGGRGQTRAAVAAADALHLRRLRELCLGPAVAALEAELAALRGAPTIDYDRLLDGFRAYQMLAGAVDPDHGLLERMLGAERRWLRGLESRGARLDWPTEVLARRQLERLALHLLPHGLGRIAPDAALTEATARDLGEALWIRQGWDEIVRGMRGQFPAIAPPGGPGLAAGAVPEGLLTRRAWDAVVADEVAEKARALERTLTGLSIRCDRDELARRLGERFRSEHRRAWLGLLAGVGAPEAATPAALPARIAETAGPASPWPALVRLALDELDPPRGISLPGAVRAPWAAAALEPIAALRGEVETFLAAGRSEDAEALAGLARRFDEAAVAAGARLAEVQSDDLRHALADGLAGLVRGLWRPIDRAAVAAFEAAWRARVLPAWQRDCAGRFPFAESAEEAPLAAFARFANPRTGVLWSAMAPIERLRAVGVAGRPALSLAPAYHDLAARAAVLRDGAFAGGEQLAVPFALVLAQRQGVADIAVSAGAQGARLYDRPDGRCELALRQGDPAGAKLAIRVVTGEWKSLEFAASEWGVLRLLRAGAPRPGGDGTWTLVWPFAGTAAGKDVVWRAQATLDGRVMGEAAAGTLLSGFAVPERIAAP